jgi:hypothetical protein
MMVHGSRCRVDSYGRYFIFEAQRQRRLLEGQRSSDGGNRELMMICWIELGTSRDKLDIPLLMTNDSMWFRFGGRHLLRLWRRVLSSSWWGIDSRREIYGSVRR